MLLVKTYLDKSLIHGIGLFADEDIEEGCEIYVPSPDLDTSISEENFNNLDENSKHHINHYGFFDKKSKTYHLAFDDIRFCNHSIEGNITQDKSCSEYKLIAKRNIRKDEEITQNYSEFEDLREGLM